ncbi:MAG: hypothetical protein ACYC56_11350 [Candidatus Aquicultor sp.]
MNDKINLAEQRSTAWPDLFGVTAGLVGMEAKVIGGGVDGALYVEGIYTGSAAITLADYNNFPVGSSIKDFQAYKTHYKTGATTWKSSAAAN